VEQCLAVAGLVPGAEFEELSEMPEFPLGGMERIKCLRMRFKAGSE